MRNEDEPIDLKRTFIYDSEDRIIVNSPEEFMNDSVSNKVFRKILDLSPLQVLIKDLRSRYQYVNYSAANGLTSPGRSAIGMSDAEATLNAAEREHWIKSEQACINEARITENDVMWTDLKGNEHNNVVLNIPIVTTDGSVVGIAVIACDTTYRAFLSSSDRLLKLIKHDWVDSLLARLVGRIERESSELGKEALARKVGGFSLYQLGIVFAFMRSYLKSLPSLMTGYQGGFPEELPVIEFNSAVIDYMNQISEVIALGVNVALTEDSPIKDLRCMADVESMRLMCFEMMQNHQKYGTGQQVLVRVTQAEGTTGFKVSFISPGERHKEPDAYRRIFTKRERFFTTDEQGRSKRPQGFGLGLHYCKTLALGHCYYVEQVPGEMKGKMYDVIYDDALHANVFWFVFHGARA